MSWVDDFNSFQNSGDVATIGGFGGVSSKSLKKPPSRKEKIEAELKLLEWHKMANDAALKAALLQTKNLKTTSPSEPTHAKDDARWIKQVIQDEHVKPLQVSKKFVLEYEGREKESDERLTNQVERHINTLKKLREKLEEREDTRSRAEEFRGWKRDFVDKKFSVLSGKTLDEIENAASGRGESSPTSQLAAKNPSSKSLKRGGSQELNTVLDSLNKLSELEQRISSLEKDNEYERIVTKDKPPVNERVTFEFKKQRMPLEGSAAISTSIGMRAKKTAWEVKLPNVNPKPPVGLGVVAVRARKKAQDLASREWRAKQNMIGVGGGGDGVFLTGMGGGGEEDEMGPEYVDREALRREKLRNQALEPAGQKNLRARVQARKTRGKEQSLGEKRHDEAMKEILRRREEQQQGRKKPPAGPVATAGKGASAGVKSKNKYMQDFEKAKAGFKKKKENMLPPAPPRSISQTAPGVRRQPATKTGGTVTRRTDMPTRRPVGGGGAGGVGGVAVMGGIRGQEARTAPPSVVVSGVSGIKVLRGQRQQR